MTRTRNIIIGLAVVFGAVLAGCSAAQPDPAPAPAPAPVTVTQAPTQSPTAAPTTVKATTPKPAAPAPVTVTAAPPPAPVTITEQQAPTVIVKQAPAPVTVTQDKPYAEGRTIYTLPGNLLCIDLKNMGFSASDAYWYSELHGNPPLMDKDLNGIPCETVYPGGARPDHIDQ